jgi:hypothetical protein
MGQGRFINQKLGKRISRKLDLTKARLSGQKRSNLHPGSNAKRSNLVKPQQKSSTSINPHA